jgi:transglutaminase-like putative cysteine protease
MIFRIRHQTRFLYDEPAYESHNELRLTPRDSAGQRCLDFRLHVDPPAAVLAYEDGFRNRVHSISVHPPHQELAIRAESIVERLPPRADRARHVTFGEFLEEDEARSREHYEFLHPSVHVPFSDRLRKFFWLSRPSPTERVAEYTARIVSLVRDQFEYEMGRTDVHSTVDDVLTAGGGVCQDFAHLTIGLLRLAGVPARYVSGYLAPQIAPGATEPPPIREQASHAWIEALLPETGWTGFDPTHCGRTHDHHVRVAVGRDYADVPPLRGVYRSPGSRQRMVVDLAIDVTEEAELTNEARSRREAQSQQ